MAAAFELRFTDGKVFPLPALIPGKKVTIGRSRDEVDVHMTCNKYISHIHCEFELSENDGERTVKVTDKSSNGTLVNGERLIRNVPRKLTLSDDVVSLAMKDDASSFRIEVQQAGHHGWTPPVPEDHHMSDMDKTLSLPTSDKLDAQTESRSTKGEINQNHKNAIGAGAGSKPGSKPFRAIDVAANLSGPSSPEAVSKIATGEEGEGKKGKKSREKHTGDADDGKPRAAAVGVAEKPKTDSSISTVSRDKSQSLEKSAGTKRIASEISKQEAREENVANTARKKNTAVGGGKRPNSTTANAREAESADKEKTANNVAKDDNSRSEASKEGKRGDKSTRADNESNRGNLDYSFLSRPARGRGVDRWKPDEPEELSSAGGKAGKKKSKMKTSPDKTVVSDKKIVSNGTGAGGKFAQKAKKTTPEVFNVNEILEKKSVKGKIKYLVSWEGYSAEANTWEPAQQLLEDVPDLVNEFEAKFTK